MQAAIRAGYAENSANEMAAKLMARPHVAAEVKRLQDGIAEATHVTVASLLREAEEARASSP